MLEEMQETIIIGKSGAKGWDFPDVLPYFQRMEASHGGTSNLEENQAH